MGTYPIKILSDEQGTPFVPLVSLDGVQTPDGEKITDLIDAKMSSEDLIAGQYVVINQEGGKATINVDLPASLNTINNLTTETSGQGALDAYQGKVLKDSIPVLVDSLDSDDANKALSARQGKILGEKLIPDGGSTGQVLKKGDNGYEWGDAADPNAIVGDGSIMSIISLTYAEYKNLEAAGELQENTEYHITDMGGSPGNSDVPADPEIVYDPNAISGDGSIKKIIEISYEEYLELEATNQLQEDTEYHINNWNEDERAYFTEQDIEWMIYDKTANHTTETQVNSMIEHAVEDFVVREEVQNMIDSKIIYDKTLSANAATVTVDGLDLEGDGGVYKIHMITRGTATNVNSIYIQANSLQQGYWCAYWRGWSNPGITTEGGAVAQSQSWIIPNAPYWQFGEVISASFGYTDIMIMKAPDGIKFNATHSLICQEIDYCGTYSCNLYSTTENLTRIIIFPSSGQLTAGTRIIISKL